MEYKFLEIEEKWQKFWKENKLFEEWSKNRKKFAKDGAGKKFESQKTKLILIGKETNKTGNNFDWREYLDGGVFYKKTNKPFAALAIEVL